MPHNQARVPHDAVAERLAARLSSLVVRPSSIAYEHARRVWNGAIDRYPSAVIRCSTRENVVQAVRVLREEGIPFAIRGGGHNVAGNAVRDGAAIVDLAGLRTVTFDAPNTPYVDLAGLRASRFDKEPWIVTVEGGCVWSEVDRLTADVQGVVPTGMISHTGVAGLTLGGGTGYLTRQFGTTSDNLLEAEVVLADGRVVRASHDSHPDLFWALRGAGHNFGAVTSFTFRVRPLEGPVLVRQSIFPSEKRADILAFFREWAPTQPRSLVTYLNVLRIPPYWPRLPLARRGESAMNVTSVFYGKPDDGERVTEPMHAVAAPLWTRSMTMRHVELQHACDDDWRGGVKHYWKPSFLWGIPDEAIERIIHWCDQAPAVFEQARAQISPQPINQFEINYRGGALGDADPNESAYPDRTSPFNMNIQAVWTNAEDEDDLRRWAQGFSEALSPFWSGVYTNFMSEAGSAPEAARIFGPEKYARLVASKREYDPHNVFFAGGLDLASDWKS
jgi:FAD/FMN-containing dehydrogenase